jgi:hypothetical protein
MKTSKTVQEKVQELYAMLATIAAKKAIYSIDADDDVELAEAWVGDVERLLNKASANQTRWTYRTPRLG